MTWGYSIHFLGVFHNGMQERVNRHPRRVLPYPRVLDSWRCVQHGYPRFIIVTLRAIIPGLAYISPASSCRTHTLAGGVLLTKDLIGMILIGLLTWEITTAKGAGPFFQRNAEPAHGSVGWAMMFGITAVLGSWAGGTLKQSDWTRYAGQPYAPTLSQLVAAPFCIILCATVGIVATSCREQIFGALIWEPFALLAQIQEFYHGSSRVRAGVYVRPSMSRDYYRVMHAASSRAWDVVCAQLGISIALNSVSAGMDLA
ncbi:permease for cytosine/purines, uracil, thiamine, allantoin-domain-containing protein [Mycena galopus ATCC 62051]|nr:permease for cytosine/purines, uracil, thiamine, allantoin-domain-containing protein [Mycena galopus ATCC 62051]